MTVNDAIKALQQIVDRGAGEVVLQAFNEDGYLVDVYKFEIDAGEEPPVVCVVAS